MTPMTVSPVYQLDRMNRYCNTIRDIAPIVTVQIFKQC